MLKDFLIEINLRESIPKAAKTIHVIYPIKMFFFLLCFVVAYSKESSSCVDCVFREILKGLSNKKGKIYQQNYYVKICNRHKDKSLEDKSLITFNLMLFLLTNPLNFLPS